MKLAQPTSFALVTATLLSSLIAIAGSSATQVMAENTNPQIVAQASPTVQFYCGKAADPSSKRRATFPLQLPKLLAQKKNSY